MQRIRSLCPIATGVLLSMLGLSCTCSEKLTDEQRLKKQIDTRAVHLYVATKVAVTKVGTEPEIKEARQRLLALIKAAVPSHVPADGHDAELTKQRDTLSVAELTTLLKAVWKLKQIGEHIVREGKDDELRPLLPLLLVELNAPAELITATKDMNTDHGLFFLALALLKIYPRSPVPLPPEIVLYEAWNTDADTLKIPGLAVSTHALKAWVYGTNDFCDLAQKETDAVERITYELAPLLQAIRLVSVDSPADFLGRLEQLDAAARAVAHGGVAICHLQRGDDKKARPALKRATEMMETLGAGTDELEYVRAFIDCGGEKDEVARGKARLKTIAAGTGARRGDREGLDALRAYCEASDETSSELARKVSLTGKLLRVAMHHAKKYGGAEALERSPVYKAVGGFAAVCQITSKGTEGVSRSVKSLQDKTKGLLDKLKK